jgi:hypothetical protein
MRQQKTELLLKGFLAALPFRHGGSEFWKFCAHSVLKWEQNNIKKNQQQQ